MKKVLIIVCILLSLFVKAQDSPKTPNRMVTVLLSSDGKTKVITENLIMLIDEIETLTFLTQEEAKSYGVNKGNVTITITPRKNVKLLSIGELLQHFNIDTAYKKFKVKINGKPADPNDQVLASVRVIKSINIDKNGNFINIIGNVKATQ